MLCGLIFSLNMAEAASYNYSVDMTDSEGKVQHMGDVQVNINQEGATTTEGMDMNMEANHPLLDKIQNYIKSSYKEFNINIHIKDGVVTLQGVVRSENDKKNIENAISKFEGVKKVDNKLQVGTLKTPASK